MRSNYMMMKSLWHNPSAFDPFFDSTIAIKGRNQNISLKACIFEEDYDEPLSDASASADRRKVSAIFPKHGEGGWNGNVSPKRGDLLSVTSWGGMPSNDTFAIEKVVDFVDSWQLSAREVKR